MALKFEIIGNNLVVTDTSSNIVKLERPVGDIFGICETGKWKIITRSGRNDLLLEGASYVGLVNSSGTGLDQAALTTFFRANLGFSSAGASALTTITGNLTYGSTLTANLAPGVSVTGYQWYRNGVAISGATNSTYALDVADIGKDISVQVSGVSFSKTALSKIIYTGAPLWRFATAFNKFPNNYAQPPGNDKRLSGRSYRVIGSTNYKSIRVRADACMLQMSDQIYDTVTPLTVIGLYIECNGLAVPVTWAGVSNPTFAAGSYDQLSDTLTPDMFGLARFSRNTAIILRGEISVGSGGRLPTTEGIETNSVGWAYDASAVQLTNLNGTGPLTYVGSGRTSSFELPFIVIGEQEDIVADARVSIGFGDSIFAGGGDWSYYQMALRGDGTAHLAGCAVAKVGGTFSSIVYAANQIGSLMKYANMLIDEMHTNSDSLDLNSLKTYSQQTWTFWRGKVSTHQLSRALKVLRVPLGVRTTGSFGSAAAQTVAYAAWNAGGTIEQLNDWFPTQVGVAGAIDYFCTDLWSTPYLIRASASGKGTLNSDWYKWNSPGYTGDGLHPSNVASSPINGLGAALRSHMLNPANL